MGGGLGPRSDFLLPPEPCPSLHVPVEHWWADLGDKVALTYRRALLAGVFTGSSGCVETIPASARTKPGQAVVRTSAEVPEAAPIRRLGGFAEARDPWSRFQKLSLPFGPYYASVLSRTVRGYLPRAMESGGDPRSPRRRAAFIDRRLSHRH